MSLEVDVDVDSEATGSSVFSLLSQCSASSSQSKQPTIEEAFSNSSAFTPQGVKQQRITDALLFMLSKDCMPIDTVDGEGFKIFVKTVEPRYKVPHRKTITKQLEDKFEETKVRIIRRLDEIQWMSLTSDIWTDPMNAKSYISLTAHYIKETKMESIIVAVKPLAVDHTADNIMIIIEDILLDWNIDKQKVVCCVTDGAANIVKAFQDLFGKSKHLHCFAHLLNLMATEAIATPKGLTDLITEVKETVTFFKKSVKAADRLKAEQLKTGSEVLKLKQEVKTRWNSTYYMLDRFITLYRFIVSVLTKLNGPPIIGRNKLDTIKEIVTLLKPLEAVTREISAEKQTTISKLIPLLRCMRSAINRSKYSTSLGEELKEALLVNFQKRFGLIEKSKMIAMATVLDPRFKKLHFESPTACASAVTDINSELKKSSVSGDVNKEILVNPDATEDIWSFHDNLVNSRINTQEDTLGGINISFRQYLQLPVVERSENPLTFWLRNKVICPDLYKLVQKYFSVVGTSVPSERVFSKAGNTITSKRNRLDPKRVEKLIFMSNLSFSEWKA
jgi:hypothetical protein